MAATEVDARTKNRTFSDLEQKIAKQVKAFTGALDAKLAATAKRKRETGLKFLAEARRRRQPTNFSLQYR